jgi:Flp pilus assembly protein TadG
VRGLRRGRPAAAGSSRDERGQSFVEFTLILPVCLLLLMIMLEMGQAFNHKLTVGYATREGARTGAALAAGGATSCAVADPANVDQQIIAAAQRILKSPGSNVVMSNVSAIRIYKATATGDQSGSLVNVWTYTPGAGPDLDPGPGVDRLDFSQSTVAWPACGRNNGINPDSLGVRIDYTYHLTTPLQAVVAMTGGSQAATLPMGDQTIMALNPTN